MAEHDQDESIREVDADAGVIATLSKAEFDIQIATAKAYPRSISKFHEDALTLATLDAETARSMYYRLPRDGREIEGPTVRLAEIIGSCWGNLHYGGRVVSEDDHFLSAQGVAWDLEKNVRANIEVRRRITNKYGKRYGDDMIVTTSNAAIAIALRNAIFKVVPVALTKSIMDAAKECSLGKGLTMEARRDNAFRAFAKYKAKPEEVLAVIGRRAVEDISVEDLIRLQGMRTAIEDGEITWPQILEEATRPADEPKAQPKPASQLLKDIEAAGKDTPKTEGEGAPVDAGTVNASATVTTGPTPPREVEKEKAETGNLDPQLDSDAITADQQRALLNAVGSAHLSPKQLQVMCDSFKVKQITAVNFGQFKQAIEALVDRTAAGEKRFG